MSIDKQPDCTTAPLDFVSDRNHLENLDPTPNRPVADKQDTEDHHRRASVSPTNAFEGFRSFSG